MALHVADCYAQAIVRQGNKVEIVTTGFIGWISCRSNIETLDGRCNSIKLLLNLPCEAQLNFTLLDVQGLADVLYHGHEVRHSASFVHDRGNGLLRGIDFPRFPSVADGCVKGLPGHQFSPQAFVESRILQT